MQVILAQPRGFCAGVDRAIEIVHDRRVVEDLKAKGVRFVDRVEQIPNGAITVFSAHGVSEKVEQDASVRSLRTLDATCPLVSKVHIEGSRYAAKGYDIILIGHENHPEVEGTVGQIPGRVLLVSDVGDVEMLQVRDPDKVAYITQTALSVDDTRNVISALRNRFPKITGPDVKEICYATQYCQAAVRTLASIVDLVLVVGAQNSSNSNRLCEVSNASGVPSYLIEDSSAFDPAWLHGKKSAGITAGASTPEELVQDLIAKLREYVDVELSTMDGIVENVRFSLFPKLSQAAGAQ